MYKFSMVVRVLMALLSLMFVGLAYAGGIYKWVDENGKVQYGDAPPDKRSHTQVHVASPPPVQPSDSTEHHNTIVLERRNYGGGPSEETLMQQEKSRKEEELRQKQREIEKKNREAKEREEQASRDQSLVDQCNRNREDFCDKGVDEIKRQNKERRDTYDNTMGCAMGRGGMGCPRQY